MPFCYSEFQIYILFLPIQLYEPISTKDVGHLKVFFPSHYCFDCGTLLICFAWFCLEIPYGFCLSEECFESLVGFALHLNTTFHI